MCCLYKEGKLILWLKGSGAVTLTFMKGWKELIIVLRSPASHLGCLLIGRRHGKADRRYHGLIP